MESSNGSTSQDFSTSQGIWEGCDVGDVVTLMLYPYSLPALYLSLPSDTSLHSMFNL
jgi:hypothetical protein